MQTTCRLCRKLHDRLLAVCSLAIVATDGVDAVCSHCVILLIACCILSKAQIDECPGFASLYFIFVGKGLKVTVLLVVSLQQ